jgi:hypothetical protein
MVLILLLHFVRPDCFRILLSVADAKSSLGLPGTVTRPGFAEIADDSHEWNADTSHPFAGCAGCPIPSFIDAIIIDWMLEHALSRETPIFGGGLAVLGVLK